MQPAIRKRNDKVIRNLARSGIIGNYLYVSAKTGAGMHEMKKAIIDADIKNHGDRIRPPQKPKKKKDADPEEDVEGLEVEKMAPPLESDPDPYGLLADQEMPQAIPGLVQPEPKASRKSNAAKNKKRNQDSALLENSEDAMRA